MVSVFCFMSFCKYSIIFTILLYFDKLCDMILIKEMSGRMDEMERRGIQILFVTVFLVVLLMFVCRTEIYVVKDNADLAGHGIEEIVNTEIECGIGEMANTEVGQETEGVTEEKREEPTEESEAVSFEDYSFFDVSRLDHFGDESKEELVERAMHDYAEEIKGEFVPVVPEGCGFPRELVVMMEEILYRSINERIGPYPYDCYYDEKLRELGSGDFVVGLEEAYELFPRIADYKEEIEDEYDAYDLVKELYLGDDYYSCDGIFHFYLAGGQDRYLFDLSYGRYNDFYDLYLMERAGDEFEMIQQFSKWSYGRPQVIQFGEEFYYVVLDSEGYWLDEESEFVHRWNFNGGIRMYRLDENPEEENLLICYLPEKYIWTGSYHAHDKGEYAGTTVERAAEREAIDLYVDKIQEEFKPGSYLGGGDDYPEVYYGDEKEWDSIEINQVNYKGLAYRVDIANCGLPVYVGKDGKGVRFFYYKSQGKYSYAKELDKLALLGGRMWFKELVGKIYTFQIHYAGYYNYILTVDLLEGDAQMTVRTMLIAPQREFVLTEGEHIASGV